MTFSGKIVLVTGASRGIGKEILLSFAKEGATVIGTATSEQGAQGISETLKSAGAQGAGMVLDVTQTASIDALIANIKEQFGAVEILVNNAGITADDLLMRMKDEQWDKVIQTNLTSIFHLCKAVSRDMMKARYGRIINISSVVGVMGNAGQTNYAAAKAGLIGFSKSLAREIGSRGVTVNVVAPGFIATDMTHSMSEAQKEALLAAVPMAKLGQPSDIAQGVLYLAGAEYVTGETLHINGGMYMI